MPGVARQPPDRELRDRSGRDVTIRPRIAVLVFPGSNDDRDAAWALGALGADAQLVWHAEEELPRDTAAVVLPGGFSYGDYLRCGAIARFAPVLDAVREHRRGRRAGARDLQRLPDPLRGRPAARGPAPEPRPRVRLPRRPPAGRADGHGLHGALRAGPGADDPGEARRGIVVRGRGALRRARGRGPARAALRGGLQRLGGRRRGRVQRGAQRVRPDAASRACGRPAARLRRRRAAARGARRRRT